MSKVCLYDVEFYRRDGGIGANARVAATSIEQAIHHAGTACLALIQRNDAQWGTRVMLVDDEAEATERATNAHFYELYDEAIAMVKRHGFVTDENGYWKHANGLYAHIDSHLNGEFSRFAGIYQHRLAPNGTDVMVALGLVPFYGDGVPDALAETLFESLLQIVAQPTLDI